MHSQSMGFVPGGRKKRAKSDGLNASSFPAFSSSSRTGVLSSSPLPPPPPLSARVLPDVTWRHVASYLPAPDLLGLLSASRLHRSLGDDETFWETLLTAQFPHHREQQGKDHGQRPQQSQQQRQDQQQRERRNSSFQCTCSREQYLKDLNVTRIELMDIERNRKMEEFLALSYCRALRRVEWKPLDTSQFRATHSVDIVATPSPREGHASCVLGGRFLVIAGGFCDDAGDFVYVKDLGGTTEAIGFRVVRPAVVRRGRDGPLQLHPQQPLYAAYGATLTPINDRQAVRFGGFRSGGYRDECCQVAILTVEPAVEPRDGSPASSVVTDFTATWEVVNTHAVVQGDPLVGDADDDRDRPIRSYLSRAYHTANLLFDRYLVVLGGMQTANSVWNPAILDTRTWTWSVPRSQQPSQQSATVPVATTSSPLASMPSPRHGHSTVWDPKRSRLVVFGGGTGIGLLRSGNDNSEVWTTAVLRRNDPAALVSCMIGDDEDGAAVPESCWWRIAQASSEALSPAESLCLERCHVAHCVSPDVVLLAFGSSRPSTNGVLAFVRATNLETEAFFRPRVTGCLPLPRFTTTSVLWKSYLIVHGGYSTQRSSALGDMHLLDLAPALKRPLIVLRGTQSLAGRGWMPVTDEQALVARRAQLNHDYLLRWMGQQNPRSVQHLPFPPLLDVRHLFQLAIQGIDGIDDEDNVDERNLDEEMEE